MGQISLLARVGAESRKLTTVLLEIFFCDKRSNSVLFRRNSGRAEKEEVSFRVPCCPQHFLRDFLGNAGGSILFVQQRSLWRSILLPLPKQYLVVV